MAILGLPEKEYFAKGHRACAGCGEALAVRLAMKAIGDKAVVVECTGCMEVVSTPYPETAWRLPWIHGAFENNASIASGVVEALRYLGKDDVKVVALGGDGGTYDIGILGLSGAFERGHDFTYICTDNEAYMNTGIQRSGATPYGASTTTSPAGKVSIGKGEWKKDMQHILFAHGSPYIATASIGYHADLIRKVKKAVETRGPTFVNIFCPCVPGWRIDPSVTVKIGKLAVETGAFPLYEIEDGKHRLNNPTDPENLKPIEEYLKLQGRFRHLFRPEKKEKDIQFIQDTVREKVKILKEHQDKGL
jgi:pyruvate ferredoxin oxidoreductase beta subunit